MEADARTTMGLVVTPQIITATAGPEVIQLVLDDSDRVFMVIE